MNLLTKKELAKKLKCSVTSIYRLRSKYKDFPKAMSFGDPLAGAKIFFDDEEVNSWLKANKDKLRCNATANFYS